MLTKLKLDNNINFFLLFTFTGISILNYFTLNNIYKELCMYNYKFIFFMNEYIKHENLKKIDSANSLNNINLTENTNLPIKEEDNVIEDYEHILHEPKKRNSFFSFIACD